MANRRLPQVIDYPPLDFRAQCEASLPWELATDRCALLIHDMQAHFLAPFAPSTIAPVIKNITSLREQCDALEVPVYYSVQPSNQSDAQRGLLLDFWGKGLQDQPERARVIADLAPLPHHHPFDKWRYSAFCKTKFLETLQAQGRDQLIVVGVYGHIGCHATVRDAFMQDIQAFAVGDAIADFSLEELTNALTDVAQRCGVVCSTSFALDELRQDRQHHARAAKDAVARFFMALIDQPEPQVSMDTELIDLGIDSVRWMTAVDAWNEASQLQLAWEAVASCENVAALCALLEREGAKQV